MCSRGSRIINTSQGRSDWEHDITATPGLAALISESQPPKVPDAQPPISIDLIDEKTTTPVPGVFSCLDSTRVSILNGSHKTVCSDEHETVLVLPDFTMVVGVPPTIDGAKELWRTALDPRLPRMGITEETSSFQTWILPYSCVIMLCEDSILSDLLFRMRLHGFAGSGSHKRRDNRCAIAAPKLEHGEKLPCLSFRGADIDNSVHSAFIECLHSKGWTADTQLEHIVEPPLESFSGTAEQKENHIRSELRTAHSAKKALILRNSHMGGHKYAGNCIIYTPQGSCVWYGRVTTHEVESIVINTIEGGLVLPPLLRGGIDLSRPGCPTLHDW